MRRFGDYAEQALGEHPALTQFLGPEVVLVPVPRSAPLVRPNALWPGRLLAEELERRGLGRCVCLELERVSRVQKNSTIRRGHERTSPEQHIESMKLTGSMESALFSADLTLVDDVVTRGSQLLGAASALRSGYPRSTIRAFAALRSMSQAEVDSVVEPVSGIIRYAAGTNASTRSP